MRTHSTCLIRATASGTQRPLAGTDSKTQSTIASRRGDGDCRPADGPSGVLLSWTRAVPCRAGRSAGEGPPCLARFSDAESECERACGKTVWVLKCWLGSRRTPCSARSLAQLGHSVLQTAPGRPHLRSPWGWEANWALYKFSQVGSLWVPVHLCFGSAR